MRVLLERVATTNSAEAPPPTVKDCNKDPVDSSTGPIEASDPKKAATGEWRVLESGVLATPTSTEVVTERGRRRVWCDPRGGGRLVCEHGWGAYHISGWNGPRAHLFPKPEWTTCDCRTATGLCGKRKRRCEPADVLVGADCLDYESSSSGGESSGGESGRTVMACGLVKVKPPSYYDTLAAQHGTTELRPGLKGARVPGVVGAGGAAFYMVKGDAPSVLRCRHGHTTNTLSSQARERRRWAASLVAAAVMGRSSKRVLVVLLLALHAARETRRARRGTAAPCGCSPAHVKACVLACGR